jgi:tetratricopeptide (TPR) repeat protein
MAAIDAARDDELPASPPEAEALRRMLDKAELSSISLDAAGALREVGEALRLATRVGDAAGMARAHGIATTCHYYRGDYVAAVASGIDACANGARAGGAVAAKAMLGVALAFSSVGELRRGEQAAARAVRLAASARDPRVEAQAHLILGCVLRDARRVEESLGELRRARAAFRRQGDPERASAAAVNIGHVLLQEAGDLDRQGDSRLAARLWRRAARHYRSALDSGRPRLGAIMVQTALADCEMNLGNRDGARSLLEQAERFLEPRDPATVVARLDYYAGEVARRLGRAEEASGRLHRALEAADGLEGDDLAADIRDALSRLAADLGDAREARRWARAAKADRDRRRALRAEFRRRMRPLWDRYLRQENEA